MSGKSSEIRFVQLVQDFFCQHLIAHRNASSQTVQSYRDALRLLFRYVEGRTRKAPADLELSDLDAPLILDFLDHLEVDRHNSVRSRNARLAAIRSFMRYASFWDLTHLATVQRVLAIPMKRFDRPLMDFLSRDEIQAILSAPDRSTWSGHRDAVMLTTFYNTGARVSEIIGLRVADLRLDQGPFLQIHGKGRKQRVVPLWRSSVKLLKAWLPHIADDRLAPVFPNRSRKPLSRSGVEHRLRVAVTAATKKCPTLQGRKISPHTLRHTTAMHLLQSGVDLAVIALWLGHESPVTTHLYVEADLSTKERALSKLQGPPTKIDRYHASDRLLAFLGGL